MSIKIDAFLAGVSKSATTWIYQCLKEHPELHLPDSDSLRYYDLKYHNGTKWYESFFSNPDSEKIIIDPSPTYLRSPVAIERIISEHPDAKFILSLRHPIDRAYSQYWHEAKGGQIRYPFSDVTHRFMLYSWIIEHGFYATHLSQLLKHVDIGRVHVILFDDLKQDPQKVIMSIFDFLGVDNKFEPSAINKKVNVAGSKSNMAVNMTKNIGQIKLFNKLKKTIKSLLGINNLGQITERIISNKNSYNKGIDPETRSELLKIYLPEIEKLEVILNCDLSTWKR